MMCKFLDCLKTDSFVFSEVVSQIKAIWVVALLFSIVAAVITLLINHMLWMNSLGLRSRTVKIVCFFSLWLENERWRSFGSGMFYYADRKFAEKEVWTKKRSNLGLFRTFGRWWKSPLQTPNFVQQAVHSNVCRRLSFLDGISFRKWT